MQGTTGQSPLIDDEITVRGTVTASFQDDEQQRGFYVQDAGDGDLGTSDGIFVQASSPGVAPGEAVQVTGTVAEQFDQTIIGAVEEFEICGNPWPLPRRRSS